MGSDDLTRRLQAAAQALDAAKDAEAAERERRDRLIVEAIDAGMSYGAVAKASTYGRSRVSKSHVWKLLSGSGRFQDQPEI